MAGQASECPTRHRSAPSLQIAPSWQRRPLRTERAGRRRGAEWGRGDAKPPSSCVDACTPCGPQAGLRHRLPNACSGASAPAAAPFRLHARISPPPAAARAGTARQRPAEAYYVVGFQAEPIRPPDQAGRGSEWGWWAGWWPDKPLGGFVDDAVAVLDRPKGRTAGRHATRDIWADVWLWEITGCAYSATAKETRGAAAHTFALAARTHTSGSSPQKDILRYLHLSLDVLRYPLIRISQRICIMDIKGYL